MEVPESLDHLPLSVPHCEVPLGAEAPPLEEMAVRCQPGPAEDMAQCYESSQVEEMVLLRQMDSPALPCEVPLLGALPPEPSSPPPDYNLVVCQDGKAGLLPHTSFGHLTMDNKSDNVSLNISMCRICHMPSDDSDECLISPCRCAGTLQFIHNTCLMKWLEITTKKSRKPPKCELCHFQYSRHKKFKFHHWRLPRVSRQDKVLHVIFLLNLLIMVACAIATVMCFLSDKGRISKFPRNKVDLTTEEIVTLSCGVLFFVSFFIAMSVEIKAKHTVYQLLVKFIMQNMEWEIDEYDKEKDALFAHKTKTMI